MRKKVYGSDVSREQFEVIRPLLEGVRRRTKPRTVDLYEVFCGVLYLLKSGCQWRMLPDDFPKWRTVHSYFQKWSEPGPDGISVLERALKKSVGAARVKQGRKCSTSFLIVDAQSVKNTDTAGQKGYDAGKKVSGIKRHIAVDTQGLPHAVAVTTADVTDRNGALAAFDRCAGNLKKVTSVLVDGGYSGEPFAEAVKDKLDATVQVAKRSELHIRLFTFVTAVAIGSAGNAQTPHLQPIAPRTVVTADASAPPVVRAGLLQSTLIELPVEEKVATVFGGDTVSWVFDAGHVASRYISIKPKVADSTTDLHIVSDHGNEYTIELREISNEKDNTHFDSKVYVTSSDPKAAENMAKSPVFVPAAEAEAKEAQLKKEADDARKAAEADHKAVATAAETFKASYPGMLHFDYTWDQKKGAALGIEQIWRDDKFTYLRGKFQKTPALYELKDGKGSLINYDFANGLYTIPKTVAQGYLSIGKQRVDFRRTKAGS